jgi:hypothetical protein
MGSEDPFEHLKHKLWSKERPRVKLAIWLLTIKSQELTDFLACRERATYHWKALDEGYNFSLNFIAIKGLHVKLWAPKVVRILTVGITGLPLGSPTTKCHLDVALWKDVENIIWGKVLASPKFGPWWVLWVWGCPWLVLAPKVFKLCTNQHVVWFVQIWMSE